MRLGRAPARGRETQQPHVLAHDVLDARGARADLRQAAVGVDAEGLGVGERILEAHPPQAQPVQVVGDGDSAARCRVRGERGHVRGRVDDVRIADEAVVGGEPARGGGQLAGLQPQRAIADGGYEQGKEEVLLRDA